MSEDAEQVEDPSVSTEEVLETLEDWYHVPALLAVVGFMFWLRVQSVGRYIRSDGVYLSGNDAWYHLRQITYTVQNFPQTMPFDPWTYFPYGTTQGQFGTLFDQLIAASALIVGLGDPSARTIAEVTVYAPVFIGTLTALPVYYIGKQLGGRTAGLFSATVLALLPGYFLQRTVAGVADHNAAEPLFQATAVLVTMVALSAAHRYKPVWEQFAERDWSGLREPVGWSVIAGAATGLYLWMWPPGVLLVGILGVFYLLQLTAMYVRGESPEHVAIVGGISMATTTVLLLSKLSTIGFSATKFSLLQLVATAAVGGFAVTMALLAREWDGRGLPRSAYASATFAVVALGVLVIYAVLPDLYATVESSIFRFIGFDAAAAERTIGEAQPMLAQYESVTAAVTSQYGFAFFGAIFGAVLSVFRAGRDDGNSASRLLLLVWFTFLTAAAFTQVRFNYYLAIPVAILNGYALYWLLDAFSGVPTRVREVDASQLTIVAVAVLLILMPPVVGIDGGSGGSSDVRVNTPMEVADANYPGPSTLAWSEAMDWMEANTPEEGNYAGAGNEGDLDYYGTYSRTDDYDYGEGYYGVMSWWDYGHYLTVMGERIPNANPFQQGATKAANYLLAPNASAANAVLDSIDEDDAKTRYVVADWQMAVPGSAYRGLAGKFDAPTQFYDASDVSPSDFRTRLWVRGENSQGVSVGLPTAPEFVKHQRYYDSQVVRLYRYHGSAVEPDPIVIDWNQEATVLNQPGLVASEESVVRQFDNMSAARAFVENDTTNAAGEPTSQIGGFAGAPSEYVPALEQYRMVSATERTSTRYFRLLNRFGLQGLSYRSSSIPAFTKVFERVDGATISGQGPINQTVTASVEMEVPSRNTSFTYTQRAETGADGEFTMRVPYSTSGYEQWGTDEGYTNVSVRANGTYTLTASVPDGDGNATTYSANATVTEGQVLGENETDTTVELDAESGSDSGTDASVDVTGTHLRAAAE